MPGQVAREETGRQKGKSDMEDKSEGIQTDRRGFLRFAGLGSIAGGAALATGVTPEPAEAAPLPPGAAGYRETEHVKTYYATARF